MLKDGKVMPLSAPLSCGRFGAQMVVEMTSLQGIMGRE
jgi:hypothetical protein